MATEPSLRMRVLQTTAELAGIEAHQIDDKTSLESLGLDSSDAVILAMEVEEIIGKEVDVGVFLRFETIAEAADEIERLIRD